MSLFIPVSHESATTKVQASISNGLLADLRWLTSFTSQNILSERFPHVPTLFTYLEKQNAGDCKD